MKGVQFVVDDNGAKTAAVIDLKQWGALWEDISDFMVSESRKYEPTISWEKLKEEMENEE